MGAGFGGRCRAIGSSRSRRLTGSTPISPRRRDGLPTGASKNCWIILPVTLASNTTDNLIQWSIPLGDDKGWIFYAVVENTQLVILLRFLPGLD